MNEFKNFSNLHLYSKKLTSNLIHSSFLINYPNSNIKFHSNNKHLKKSIFRKKINSLKN